MYSLETKVEKLTRVGKTTSRLLKKIGIETVIDLIRHYPFRYDDFSQLLEIKDLKLYQQVTIKGRISLITSKRTSRKRMFITKALLEDDSGSVEIVWFNQPYLAKTLKAGDQIIVSGKTELNNLNLHIICSYYQKADQYNQNQILPVYSLTSGLTQKQIRFLMDLIIDSVELVVDWLPQELIKKNQLLDLSQAIKNVHFPADSEILKQARYRLKFDELFLIQLISQLNKKYLSQVKAPKIKFQQKAVKNFVSGLPFELTPDQKKSAWQVLQDLEKAEPMNRLLEGDVGAGKTIVAAIICLNVILNQFQVAVMAPTEILARQHFQNILKLFEQQKFNIALLTGSERYINQEKVKELSTALKNREIDLIIGTHALIQEKIEYENLGLVVIDEQHRFGVEQRKKLKTKNLNKKSPHFLSMTATPIPRSLALILYGDLDLSIIKTMPKGRKQIITKLIEENSRIQAYQFIKEQIASGRQVFVICPLIDPSDKLGVKSVKDEYKKLDQEVFPDLKIGLLHGKLKVKEKEEVMQSFKDNKTKILVSTSVVEVGVDIPNASIMMIEGADRFGLAQLHQFRGRVGRGEHQSYCFLFSENLSPKTRERLQALVNSTDGFALAEYDLKFRGPGEVYGTRQSGLPDFKIASFNDLELIELTKNTAKDFLTVNKLEEFPLLKNKLEQVKMQTHLE